MLYITLDTCVWLRMLKVGLDHDDNVFNEMCYWIENGSLVHITPENIIREWESNKTNEIQLIVTSMKKLQKDLLKPFASTNLSSSTTFQEEKATEVLIKRVERIETILKTYSEIAKEDPEIYNEAARRNLNRLAPNHVEDSYRDTINILSILKHIKTKGYEKAYFTTINYKDFSLKNDDKHSLHSHLINEFNAANLEYIFWEEEPFGHNVFNKLLSDEFGLPLFLDYLKEKIALEKKKELETAKEKPIIEIANPDEGFIENIKYIDLIISKKNPTQIEQTILSTIITSHPSYEHYFLRNVEAK
jgi:hypothetical protein